MATKLESTSFTLTSDGDYTYNKMIPGAPYLLTLKGSFNGGTVTLGFNNGPSASFLPVDGKAFPGDDPANPYTEARIVAPTDTLQLTSQVYGGPVKVSIVPLKAPIA